MVLSDTNAIFLDISSLTEGYDHNLLWSMLVKKHNLLRSKIEYAALLQSMTDDSFTKAQLYQREILAMQEEVDKINESLTHSR